MNIGRAIGNALPLIRNSVDTANAGSAILICNINADLRTFSWTINYQKSAHIILPEVLNLASGAN